MSELHQQGHRTGHSTSAALELLSGWTRWCAVTSCLLEVAVRLMAVHWGFLFFVVFLSFQMKCMLEKDFGALDIKEVRRLHSTSECLGLYLTPVFDSSFLLMQTVGGSNDGSHE